MYKISVIKNDVITYVLSIFLFRNNCVATSMASVRGRDGERKRKIGKLTFGSL